ncbi:MAG: outer membrane lipoprotein-sorting protein [Bacteroidetes bacterium]|nr:outer membrane lipoprotein-sorting protein [Bacteroidota bacterium]
MFKKIIFLFVVLTCSIAIQAQTAEEVLAKYFETIGGLDNWMALKSTKSEGSMAMQGMEFNGTIYSTWPNKLRVNISFQGMDIVQAYDGEDAWMIIPMQDPEPQKMPADQAEQMTREEFPGSLFGYKEKGHNVEFEGKEEMEGTETYKIKLTKKNGDIENYFFETENYVPIMVSLPIKSGPMKGQMSESFFSDYQEVDGLYFPFFLETKVNGQSIQKITIKSIVLNEEFEEGFFSMPGKEKVTAKISEEKMPAEEEMKEKAKMEKVEKEREVKKVVKKEMSKAEMKAAKKAKKKALKEKKKAEKAAKKAAKQKK